MYDGSILTPWSESDYVFHVTNELFKKPGFPGFVSKKTPEFQGTPGKVSPLEIVMSSANLQNY